MIEIDLPIPEPDYTNYLGFEAIGTFPDDPVDVDQFGNAGSNYDHISRHVETALEHDLPITPNTINYAFQSWHDRHYDPLWDKPEADYTLANVLAIAKRVLVSFENMEDFGDGYQEAVTTHDLIEQAVELEENAPPQI